MGQSGAISAGSQQTANAGRLLFEQGGNAIDAAIGAAFASFVAEPGLVHLGGSGLAQVYDGNTGQAVVYDFFSNMPGLGRQKPEEQTLDFKKIVVDFGATTQEFYLGRGSVAVPGNIFGLCTLHRDFGSLPLPTVLRPAIDIAQNGFKLPRFHADTLLLLKEILTATPSIQQITMPEGRYLTEGDDFRFPALAETLTELGQTGEKMLRSGPFAQRFVRDQVEKGGLVTQQDLIGYNVLRRPPIEVTYRDHTILLPPPSSSGGILIAFALKLMSRFNLREFAHGSADHLQLLIEVMAATGRARPHWEEGRRRLTMGEAMGRFLDDQFVTDFANEAMVALVEGRPSRIRDEKPGPPNTSHLSVIDDNNLAVSLTTTAGESAGYILPDSGFIPNNMLGEADLFPDGFHNMPAGERIFTMMTPTIVLKAGRPRLIIGSGGSMRIRSAILQVISNFIDFEFELPAAVEQQRVHLEHGTVQCEAGFETAVLDELGTLGYQVNPWESKNMYFGGTHAIAIAPDGKTVPVGDPRREGAVA